VVVAVDARPWPEARTFLEEHCDAFHDLESDKFRNRATLSGLRRILHQEQPDLVQTWMHHADLVGGVAAWLSGVPKVIWSIHCREIHRSPGESRVKAGLIGPALSATSRWVPAAIVSCSQAAIEDHRRRGYPASRMRWIANGIDASRFRPNDKARSRLRDELTIPEDAPVVGFVGRFHEMKDPATLFHAIHRMQAKQPDVHFLLCGGGAEELDEATHLAWRRLPAIEKVHFLPFRPDPENLYPAMDLFTLTSRTEACPMTLLEAMACGVPCVASDTGDCRFLIDGLGEMVEPGDGAGFQQAWSRTLNWTLEKPELGNQVREHVHQNFSIEGCIRAYESLYNELVPASKS
jgi:glycosyltransferase involved in cell wall biosynthesis